MGIAPLRPDDRIIGGEPRSLLAHEVTDSVDVYAPPFRLTAVISSLGMGGAERIMALLTGAWVERGWEVVLLTLAAPTRERFFQPDRRIDVQALDLARESQGVTDAVANNARRLRVMRDAIRSSRPDVILSFMVQTNVLTILASIGLGIPVVVEEHSDPSAHPLKSPWQLLRLMTYPLAASVVALSEPALTALGRARGRRGRVVPNPVMPPPPGRVVPTDPPVILSIGRLVPEKGFDSLISAFARLAESHREWQLEIWGEGPERAALERLRDSLGLGGRVLLPGRTRDPYQVLRRASVFVMSSRFEGFGNTLAEAMSCGLPVISFDCPSGPRQLIRDGIDGLLVQPDDLGALATGIERLVLDRDLARRLGSRAPEIVDRFALSRVLERWDSVFEEVTGRTIRVDPLGQASS
jgi:GalNAc-alpha-(1->4)-GalNAc-alpha-(1->3)-diNAcBac-PP-undecaprenol alpha-1,4-N-acetyl-D-galactosaminyltransferase